MKCEDCQCELKTARVLGWGNKDSQLMILCESPGKEDTIKREPLLGKDDQELLRVLNELGVNKKDLYITHCVCHMTTSPTKEEIVKCRKRLIREINEVNPKVILCLGKTPTYIITGLDTKIGAIKKIELRPLPIFNQKIKIISTWYPIFKNNKLALPQFKTDIQKALIESDILKFKEEKINLKLLLDFNEIILYIKEMYESGKFFAFDFETTGGAPHSTTIIGISFCYKWDESVYIPLHYRDTTGDLKLFHSQEDYEKIKKAICFILKSPKNPKSAFNKKYEIEVAKCFWGIDIARIVIDPFLTYYLRNEEEKKPSLEFMEELYFPNIPKLKNKIKGMKYKDYSLIPFDDLWIYGAEDSLFTFRIAIIERKKLEEVRGYIIE